MITGIICEYNPLHLGHKKQIDLIKADDPEGFVVCLMSGNFVQRGKPAIFDKSTRARAALYCGADLVLELPVTAALSSAEGFAAEGVRILGSFCNRLCFGAENADKEPLMATARALLSENFKNALRTELDKGLSFPAARQAALEAMGLDGSLLASPNNILAVEYCKAIISQNSAMMPYPVFRGGNYHDIQAERENPSASAVRFLLEHEIPWADYVPEETLELYRNATQYTLACGERAILAKLRTMTAEEFATIPYGSEGLWRKLMHAARKEATLEQILTATKSKRYTRTRLDRMVLCAFLGLTAEDLASPAPYARVLGFNDRGRGILKLAREHFPLINAGESADEPYVAMENRCGALYGLFSTEEIPAAPDAESKRRVQYIP